MSSAPRGLAPREGLELVLMKMGCAGPPFEPHRRPQAGKSGDPHSQDADKAAITSLLQPRNPTLLLLPCHSCPVGASSRTMSSTATARRPSSTSPDEVLSSRQFSRPVLHLQGAAPSPQHRLNLLHQNRNILTDSSDEAEAYSALPKRLYTHRIAPSP